MALLLKTERWQRRGYGLSTYPLLRHRLPVPLGLEKLDRLHAVQHLDPALKLPEHHMLPVQVGDGLRKGAQEDENEV